MNGASKLFKGWKRGLLSGAALGWGLHKQSDLHASLAIVAP